MKRHRFFISFGVFLLTLGLAGMALVQTGVIFKTAKGRPDSLFESKAPEQPSESGGQQLAAPGPEERPVQQGNDSAIKTPQQQSPQVSRNDKPVPVPGIGSGNRTYPRQLGQSEMSQKPLPDTNYAARSLDSNSMSSRQRKDAVSEQKKSRKDNTAQPVVIRIRYNPARTSEIRVARVHFGDRVVLKIRRIGNAERQIYLTFSLPDGYASNRRVSRFAAVITPVNDNDQLSLTAQRDFGPDLTEKLDSKKGAVLKLGSRESSFSRYDRGYYEIEMKIYPGNRWNIRPRSFI